MKIVKVQYFRIFQEVILMKNEKYNFLFVLFEFLVYVKTITFGKIMKYNTYRMYDLEIKEIGDFHSKALVHISKI